MTFKKVAVITVAGAVLLAGAITLSMNLTARNKMEIEVAETPVKEGTEPTEDDIKTLENMENMPLYFEDTDTLLLPLRNTMEGLGGSVTWNTETKRTEVSYRGRVLEVQSGEKDAMLNGYEITLPEAVQMINGCLYAEEAVISAYYTGDVDFNHEAGRVTLQMKDGTEPVVAVKEIVSAEETGGYAIDVPVIIGLNDGNYEKSLNESLMQEMQAYAAEFMAEEAQGSHQLQLELNTGLCSKDFLSIWWEGERDGSTVNFAKNIDLLGQKTVTLADMLTKDALQAVQKIAGEDWTADRFYLDAEGGLVLLTGSQENSQEIHHWTTEGKPLAWKEKFGELFEK